MASGGAPFDPSKRPEADDQHESQNGPGNHDPS
jgi:hypothetical protein